MTWFKVDDGFWRHPKVDALRAFGAARFACAVTVWTLLGSDCADQLSDGFTSILRAIRVTGFDKPKANRALLDLVSVGLLDRDGDGFRFHDWMEYQPNRAEVEERRAKRVAAGRIGGTVAARSKKLASASPVASDVFKQTSTPSRPVPSRPVSEIESESTKGGGTSAPPLPPSHGIPDWQTILSRESKGRIDPNGGSVSLMVGMREAIAISGYTRGDLEALGRLAATGALERLVRGKGSRRTVTLPDLHGFNGDWAPLTDAIVEARERARKATQPATASTPADPPQKLMTPEQIAAGARAFREQREEEKREKLRAEAAARAPREGQS